MTNKEDNGRFYFKPDDVLINAILTVAKRRDIRSMRTTFLLILEHPEIAEIIGESKLTELKKKYSITKTDEVEKDEKRKAKKIKWLMDLKNWTEEEATEWVNAPKEDRQEIIDAPVKKEEQPEPLPEPELTTKIPELEKSIEDTQKKLENPDIDEKFRKIWNDVLEVQKAELVKLKGE